MSERLVMCDIDDLVNMPTSNFPVPLDGSPKQIVWANALRDKLAPAWSRALSPSHALSPSQVIEGLYAITDATWWIANRDATAYTIRWPESWLAPKDQQAETPENQHTEDDTPPPTRRGMESSVTRKLRERIESSAKHLGRKPTRDWNGLPDETIDDEDLPAEAAYVQTDKPAFRIPDIQQFESFARKAALSPELAYLTITALVYRQVKDPRVLALFRESRERVDEHLAAINKIIG